MSGEYPIIRIANQYSYAMNLTEIGIETRLSVFEPWDKFLILKEVGNTYKVSFSDDEVEVLSNLKLKDIHDYALFKNGKSKSTEFIRELITENDRIFCDDFKCKLRDEKLNDLFGN